MFNVESIIGTYLGAYRLTLALNTETTNALFLAEKDTEPGRVFLVKINKDLQAFTSEQQEDFLQRVNLLQTFRHPFVLPILDASFQQSGAYIVTTYEENGSLFDILKQQTTQRFPLDKTYALLARIGEALQTAHENGIIHGNLKPQNILFDTHNNAFLSDFLVIPPAISRTTAKQQAIMALGYTAPEQRPARSKATRESDQYSLGCIAYELFTGQQPFTIPSKSQPEKSYKMHVLLPPRQFNPDLTSSMETALLKSLAREPDERYPDIRTFLAELGIVLDIYDHNIYIQKSTNQDPQSEEKTPTIQIPENNITLPTETITPAQPSDTPSENPDQPLQPIYEVINAEPALHDQTYMQYRKEELLARALQKKPRRSNSRLIVALILLVLALFGATDYLYTLFTQAPNTSQSTSAANTPGKVIIAVNTAVTTNTPQSTQTAQTTQSTIVPVTQPTPMPTRIPTVPPPANACAVTYTVSSDNGTQFVAYINITNKGTTPINGWTLSWTYANDQHLSSWWGTTTPQQMGPHITLQNLSWNATINPGQSTANTKIGFIGHYHTGNTNPTVFTLNDMVCS